MLFPLVIGGACIIGSVAATWFVKLGANKSIMINGLQQGLSISSLPSDNCEIQNIMVRAAHAEKHKW